MSRASLTVTSCPMLGLEIPPESMEPADNDALAMASVLGLLMMDGEVAAIVPAC